MSKPFEVLCVSMHQSDMSLYRKMNIAADAVIANQTERFEVMEAELDGHRVRMYSTATRGVGVNRNTALMYAEADVCLLADDDMTYADGYAEKIVEEFEHHPEADAVIFNIGTSTPQFGRIPTKIKKYAWLHAWSRNPFGAPRLAFRLESVRKRNLCFTTYFGGGCLFRTGEDSIFITQLLNSGAKILLSPVYIGDVAYSEDSTSIIYDIHEKMYTRGALLEAQKNGLTGLMVLYYSFFRKNGIPPLETWKFIHEGRKGYRSLRTYQQYQSQID
ncbi:MAG: glycosyltransferase family 2 protein [Oscillospiraceae bacterium]|nr:glycosyltransferase family 2 protein [Oscillospiraceae bacterium]